MRATHTIRITSEHDISPADQHFEMLDKDADQAADFIDTFDLDTERANGDATIEKLQDALNAKDHFDAESMWPKDPFFTSMTSADIDAMSTDLYRVIEGRINDVLDGPGMQIIERGECEYPQVVEVVLEARNKREKMEAAA